jgi:hypothetical protein
MFTQVSLAMKAAARLRISPAPWPPSRITGAQRRIRIINLYARPWYVVDGTASRDLPDYLAAHQTTSWRGHREKMSLWRAA